MKYCTLDLETTCINPKCLESILMFSFVIEDSSNNCALELNELPHYSGFINHKKIVGEPYALQMNQWILKILAKVDKQPRHPVIEPEHFESSVHAFLNAHFPNNQKIILAGKNVGSFDLQFLPKSIQDRFAARSIDPGSIFINWDSKYPPSLDEVKKITGRDGIVAHDAYEDCLDVIGALRTTYPGEK